jgi:hypothetical protein
MKTTRINYTDIVQYEVKDGKLFASFFREGVGGKGFVVPIRKGFVVPMRRNEE